MPLNEHIANFLQIIMMQLKTAIVYLQLHPLVHYMIITTLLVIALLLLISLKKKHEVQTAHVTSETNSLITSKDLDAIAGDDVVATKLDLAKAYIEMDQKKLAAKILQQALKQGTREQQETARELLNKAL